MFCTKAGFASFLLGIRLFVTPIDISRPGTSKGPFLARAADPGRVYIAASLLRIRASMWCFFCSRPSKIRGGIFLKGPDNKHNEAISSPEISPLSRRALYLPFVKMFTCICFPFSRMGICNKLSPGHFSMPLDHASPTRKHFTASCRSVSWARFRNPSLSSVQPNTALDSFASAPCASPSGFCGAQSGILALDYMVLIADHVWLRSRIAS